MRLTFARASAAHPLAPSPTGLDDRHADHVHNPDSSTTTHSRPQPLRRLPALSNPLELTYNTPHRHGRLLVFWELT